MHTDTQGNDLPQPETVRVYCWASSQHFADPQPRALRGHGQNFSNVVSTSMFFRANLDAMDRWAQRMVRCLRQAASSACRRHAGLHRRMAQAVSCHSGVATPTSPNVPPLLDFGPDAERILREPPQPCSPATRPPQLGEPYPVLVPQVNADGNDMSGVRLPEVAVPLGTYTGWNLRARGHGHGAQLRFECSYVPFPESPQERQITGDPRRSILERYGDKTAYVAAITAAARELVAQ